MLLIPAAALLPAALVVAGLVLLGVYLCLPARPRPARHEADPGVVEQPPAPFTPEHPGLVWLDGPPPCQALRGDQLVPPAGACVTGHCEHRAHRIRPATRPVPYPPRSARLARTGGDHR